MGFEWAHGGPQGSKGAQSALEGAHGDPHGPRGGPSGLKGAQSALEYAHRVLEGV